MPHVWIWHLKTLCTLKLRFPKVVVLANSRMLAKIVFHNNLRKKSTFRNGERNHTVMDDNNKWKGKDNNTLC